MKYDSKLLLSVCLVLGGCAPGMQAGLQAGAQGGAGAGEVVAQGRLARGVIPAGSVERSTLPVGLLRTESRGAVRLATTSVLGVPVGDRRSALPAGISFEPARLAAAVLREANVTRGRHGAGSLRTDAALTRAALRYARELADRQEVEHLSATPGRRTFRERIEAEGASPRIGGENLARLTAGAETLGDRVVDAWMRSPGHRYNLLDPIFARTGIGVWLGVDGVWYVVQVYATGS